MSDHITLYLEADTHHNLKSFAAAHVEDPSITAFCGSCINPNQHNFCEGKCSPLDLEDMIGGFLYWLRESKNPKEKTTLVGFDIEKRKSILKDIMEHRISSRELIFDNYFPEQTLDLGTLVYAHHLKKDISPPESLDLNYCLKYVGLSHCPEWQKHPENSRTRATLEAEIFSRITFGRPHNLDLKKFPLPPYFND